MRQAMSYAGWIALVFWLVSGGKGCSNDEGVEPHTCAVMIGTLATDWSTAAECRAALENLASRRVAKGGGDGR